MRTINPAISSKTFSQQGGGANAIDRPVRIVRITDLYRKALEQAMYWRNEAKTKTSAIVRADFRERARSLEIDATNLAHCIAKYGDQEVAFMNLSNLLAEAKGLICDGCNPWAQGLAQIEEIVRKIPLEETA